MFFDATKKLVCDSSNPANYGYQLHEKFITQWKERTSWNVTDESQEVSNQIGDFVNAKSIG